MLRRNIALDIVLLSLPLGLYLLLKSYSLFPAVSDENIYFYDAWLMAQGAIPYRDFFFAHPPFHLIPGWIVMLVTGEFNLSVMKLLPVAAAAATGVLLYGIARPVAGRIPALLAVALFLFSHDLLRASSHWTGINWSIFWMTLGLLCALRRKDLLCGIALGLGVSTGVYVLPGALAIGALLWAQRPVSAARCLAAAAITCLAINLPFLAAGGKNYLDSVFLFHSMKPPQPGLGFSDQLGNLLFHNFFFLTAPLYLFPLLAVRIGKALRERDAKADWFSIFDVREHPFVALGLWSLLAWAGYLLFLSTLSRVYHYYFLLLFPFAALSAALFLSSLLSLVRSSGKSLRAAGAALVVAFAVVAGFFIYPLIEQTLSYFPAEQGKTRTYQTPQSALPDCFTVPVRLVWRADRTIGRRYTGIQYYLWHESRTFSEAEEIAALVRSNVTEGDRIFGDSTTTPLVALLSGVPIAGNFVDTNTMRFRAGLPPAASVIDDLQRAIHAPDQRPAWVLVNPARGIGRIDEFRRFFDEYFYTVTTFRTRHYGTYLLMKGKGET